MNKAVHEAQCEYYINAGTATIAAGSVIVFDKTIGNGRIALSRHAIQPAGKNGVFVNSVAELDAAPDESFTQGQRVYWHVRRMWVTARRSGPIAGRVSDRPKPIGDSSCNVALNAR